LIGDPGLDDHNVRSNFALAAQQNANELIDAGNRVIGCRVSSVQDVNTALTTNGSIDGGVIYFGHSGPHDVFDADTREYLGTLSILAVGQETGLYTNVAYNTVQIIQATLLGTRVQTVLNGCNTVTDVSGMSLPDPTGNSKTSIAKLLARQLQRRVVGYPVGMYFSLSPATSATSKNYTQEPNPLPAQLPMHLIPEGTPGAKPPLWICDPVGACHKP
jgi:hypothetical protein